MSRSIIKSYRNAYLSKETTVTAVIKRSLERLRAIQPEINAVTDFLDEIAIPAAERADEKLKSITHPEALPPLFGIPFSIKGSLALQGRRWVGGSWYRKDTVASFTAPAIQKAIENGAIPVCVTNTPEASVWIETSNSVFGRTSNPYNLKRTCGGSSGGEAAAIACRATVFGIGTDLGGSIRTPASFCGISGFKPSPGAVAVSGQWPEPIGDISDYVVLGPMAQTASDLESVFNAIRIPEFELSSNQDFSISHLKVIVLEDMKCVSSTLEVRSATREAAERLRALGATVEICDASLFRNAVWIWLALLEANADPSKTFGEVLGAKGTGKLFKELIKVPFGLTHHTLPALGFALIEEIAKLSPVKLSRFYEEGIKLRETLSSRLSGNTVLLSPTFPRVAPLHDRAKLRPMDFIYAGIYNVMKLPSASVPWALSKQGLPIGIQITSSFRNDYRVLKVAQLLENEIALPALAK